MTWTCPWAWCRHNDESYPDYCEKCQLHIRIETLEAELAMMEDWSPPQVGPLPNWGDDDPS